tara:strand:- start:989 stop:2842 length:1854 start_codon:yes stop_codon:yes gene_type:complete
LDAGSTPASSTKHSDGLDLSRPPHPFHTKAYSQTSTRYRQGSIGLEKAAYCLENDTRGHSGVTYADNITQQIGTRECQLFRQKFFNRFEPVCHEVAHEYVRISARRSYVEANRFLNSLSNELQIHDLNLTTDLKNLSNFADKMASLCTRIFVTHQNNKLHCVKLCQELFLKYAMSPPLSTDIDLFERQVCESLYWLRKVKSLALQAMEHVRRQCSVINNAQSPYCSDSALKDWTFTQEQNRAYLENTYIQNEAGESISLAEAAKGNVSNPKVRRCEMMVRIRGFEEVAAIKGHVGDFYTLTTPSKMHSHHKNGQQNPKYNGTTTKAANEYMQNVWQRIRAKLDRDDLRIYGLRVVEPHHDSTPHWHLMLFMHPDDRLQIREIITRYALAEDSSEAGADKYRVKCTEIDPNRGSASGYIAKYIAKNIDGEFLDADSYGNDAKISAKKITAWASLNKIRQFQFIGSPSVSLWRELRKFKDDYPEELAPYAEPANRSDWAAFVLAMGGVNLPRSNRPIHLEYERESIEQIDRSTGEVTQSFNRGSSQRLSGYRLINAFIPIIKKHWSIIQTPPHTDYQPSTRSAGGLLVACKGGSRRWRTEVAYSHRKEPPSFGAFLGLV